jgi:hypothetical protein
VPNEMREFAREARDFLDAHAAGREEDAQFRWGEGDDSVAYFRDDPPDVTERRAKSAELQFGGPPFTISDSCDG